MENREKDKEKDRSYSSSQAGPSNADPENGKCPYIIIRQWTNIEKAESCFYRLAVLSKVDFI